MNKAVQVTYKGNVQGIGFRYTAIDLAMKYPVKGYVKNTSSGDVEIVAEGEEKTVNQFLDAVNGEMGRFVHETVVNPLPFSGRYQDFRIEY